MNSKQLQQLIASGAVTASQGDLAQQAARKSRISLLQALLEIDEINPDALLGSLAAIYKLPYSDISTISPDSGLAGVCSEETCRKYTVAPLRVDGAVIEIATDSPDDIAMLDALAFSLGKRIVPVFTRPDLIRQRISELYRHTDTDFGENIDLGSAAKSGAEEEDAEIPNLDELKRKSEDSPIINLVTNVIIKAIKSGSSDIHIEAGERESVVRLRVDGLLKPVMNLPDNVHPLVVSRIKIMAKMDISNTRTPQDGRCQIKLWGRNFDMRISTLPSMYGEKAVLRILDKSGQTLKLDSLGFDNRAYEQIRECLSLSTGCVLVVGPTGSGKTTTLYSFLRHIQNETLNIVTVEDPVEYQIKGINQVQVNTKSGMTFASVLRSILRQDPDVVMVGEIRDQETAHIAMHAAQTGHLVLSTLHTNSAPATVTRLLEMGIEAPLLTSSLNLVVAQRLLRRLCPKCRRESPADKDFAKRFDIPEELTFYKKSGCKECMDIGYSGRLGIHEVLYVNDRMRALISSGASSPELMQAAREDGTMTLFESAMNRALSGQTSLDEVMRVCSLPEEFSLRQQLADHGQLLSLGESRRRRRQSQVNQAGSTGQQTILVVDDSSELRELVAFVLKASGYHILQAEDGQQAWEMLQSIKPDLLLLDREMPKMSGIELLKQVREQDRLSGMPVIMLTSRKGEEDEVLGLNSGADDYLGKPLEPLKLQARVKKILATYANLRSAK